MVTATICTIGDEILIGQIVDTNSAKISIALNSIGIKVNNMVSIPDNELEIINTIERCLAKSNIVVITGGLGPTKDDITKTTLAKLTDATGYITNNEQLEVIKEILSARDIPLSDINLAQADVPNSCKVIVNKRGTAPCMQFNIAESKYGLDNTIFSLPGVPFEMEAALSDVLEAIKTKYTLEEIFHKTIYTFGIPESTLAKQIEQWEDALPNNIKLAYLPNPTLGVRLRLSIYGSTKELATSEIEERVNMLKEILQDAIYGEGDTSLQKEIGNILLEKGATLSAAESCTGGLISAHMTSISGASKYYWGSVTSYDNSVKVNTLGVNKETIEMHGAVSEECVREMAEGVKRALNTTYSIATSGVAGPGGGTQEKPVGMVWVAVAGPNGTLSHKFMFKGTRELNIERFASSALNLFRLAITNNTI